VTKYLKLLYESIGDESHTSEWINLKGALLLLKDDENEGLVYFANLQISQSILSPNYNKKRLFKVLQAECSNLLCKSSKSFIFVNAHNSTCDFKIYNSFCRYPSPIFFPVSRFLNITFFEEKNMILQSRFCVNFLIENKFVERDFTYKISFISFEKIL
jgi:hypothetical protein